MRPLYIMLITTIVPSGCDAQVSNAPRTSIVKENRSEQSTNKPKAGAPGEFQLPAAADQGLLELGQRIGHQYRSEDVTKSNDREKFTDSTLVLRSGLDVARLEREYPAEWQRVSEHPEFGEVIAEISFMSSLSASEIGLPLAGERLASLGLRLAPRDKHVFARLLGSRAVCLKRLRPWQAAEDYQRHRDLLEDAGVNFEAIYRNLSIARNYLSVGGFEPANRFLDHSIELFEQGDADSLSEAQILRAKALLVLGEPKAALRYVGLVIKREEKILEASEGDPNTSRRCETAYCLQGFAHLLCNRRQDARQSFVYANIRRSVELDREKSTNPRKLHGMGEAMTYASGAKRYDVKKEYDFHGGEMAKALLTDNDLAMLLIINRVARHVKYDDCVEYERLMNAALEYSVAKRVNGFLHAIVERGALTKFQIQTAFEEACRVSSAEVALTLLEAGANPNRIIEYRGHSRPTSPLAIVLDKNPNPLLIGTLLNHGVQPNSVDSGTVRYPTKEDFTTADLQRWLQEVRLASHVLHVSDDDVNTHAATSLEAAIRLNNSSLTEQVVNRTGTVDLQLSNGRSAIGLAAELGALDSLSVLVGTAVSSDLDACDPGGMTPLHRASSRGNLVAARVLLNQGANASLVTSAEQKTALDLLVAANTLRIKIIPGDLEATLAQEFYLDLDDSRMDVRRWMNEHRTEIKRRRLDYARVQAEINAIDAMIAGLSARGSTPNRNDTNNRAGLYTWLGYQVDDPIRPRRALGFDGQLRFNEGGGAAQERQIHNSIKTYTLPKFEAHVTEALGKAREKSRLAVSLAQVAFQTQKERDRWTNLFRDEFKTTE